MKSPMPTSSAEARSETDRPRYMVECATCGQLYDARDPENILTHWHQEPIVEPVRTPGDLAQRMGRRMPVKDDPFIRQTWTLPIEAAREQAASYFREYPKEGYDTAVESWGVEADGQISFTMRRSRTAD